MGGSTEVGDLPQECVYEAGKLIAKRYYRRLAEVQKEGGIWSAAFFVDGDDPRIELAGQIAVVFDIDAGEKTINVYEALADGSFGLSEETRQGMRGLRCGDVFDTVRTVRRLMPDILDKAEVLYKKCIEEVGE